MPGLPCPCSRVQPSIFVTKFYVLYNSYELLDFWYILPRPMSKKLLKFYVRIMRRHHFQKNFPCRFRQVEFVAQKASLHTERLHIYTPTSILDSVYNCKHPLGSKIIIRRGNTTSRIPPIFLTTQ